MDNSLVNVYKYFHNLNDYQITNKTMIYLLMSMFYLQQICHGLNDFSTYLVEDFEISVLNVINHSILLFQVKQPSNIISIPSLIYIFFIVLSFYIFSNLLIFYNFKNNPNSFDSLKQLISLFDFVNYFFLGDVILNNSLKSLVCNNVGYSDFLLVKCSGTQYYIIIIISIMNIFMELLILIKYCYFCNTILMNNSFPLCRNVCKIEIYCSTTKVINIVLRLIKSDDLTTKIIVTCFNTLLYLGISIYVLIYLPFHKRMSNYMVFYYNSFVFFFYLFIIIFVLSNLSSMLIFLIVLFFVNHILSKTVFNYRVNYLIFKKNITSVNKYYEIIFISNYFLELYENEFDHYSKCLKFGIISRHLNECTNIDCPLKNKNKLYFPIKKEWSSGENSVYENTTFIFLIICALENFNMNYPNKFINLYLSELFLIFVGNQNKTLFYIYNFKNMKVGKLEMYHYVKLSEDIEKVLRKKLKNSRESKGFITEEIDIMQYFEITHSFDLLKKCIKVYLRNSEKFWKIFVESSKILIIDKIYQIASNMTKDLKIIKLIWKNIDKINSNYSPAREYYLAFFNLLGDLFELKRVDNSAKKDSLVFNGQNFYSLIFNHENLIINTRGNFNKPDEISYISNNCEEFLNYKSQDLINKKMKILIPNPIANNHEIYVKNYLNSGYTTKIDQIKSSILLKKHDDPIFVIQFVKYYPSLSDDIYFTGIFSKSIFKNGLIILDYKFNITYISSSILTELDLDLDMLKKLNLDLPFFLLCPNILKFFRITKYKIHNKTNIDGDLNQVVLDFYIPPFIQYLIKELKVLRNNSFDSRKLSDNEDKSQSSKKIKLKKLCHIQYKDIIKMKIDKTRILDSYKNILNLLTEEFRKGEYEKIDEIIKTTYEHNFQDSDYPLLFRKVKIDFSNFSYMVDDNLIISEIKILGKGFVNNSDEIFLQKLELDDLIINENSQNDDDDRESQMDNFTKNQRIIDYVSTTSDRFSALDKSPNSTEFVIQKPGQDQLKEVNDNKEIIEEEKENQMANTGSVDGSLSSTLNHLSNSKKIIGETRDYQTNALSLAFVVTRKIFPLILISFQLFLYIQSLLIVSKYQIFLYFNSQQFEVYYSVLSLTNYLSLAEFFIEQNTIINGKNISSYSLSQYNNYTLNYYLNNFENFQTYDNLKNKIVQKYDNFYEIKSNYDSYQWENQITVFKKTEFVEFVNIRFNNTEIPYNEDMTLFSAITSMLTLLNKFLIKNDIKILNTILFNVYNTLIPKINLILKNSLEDIINVIQMDQSTFTLVFIISITCIFTSGSLNYYTYIKIKALAERTFIIFKDIPIKTIKIYLDNLDKFQTESEGNKYVKKFEEKTNKKKQKKTDFYVKKLNLINFFFLKLVFLMFSLSAFFFLNYFIMIQYMNDQQTYLTISNFLFVYIYNNTATKLQMNELLKQKYQYHINDNLNFDYSYDNHLIKENFFILGGNHKNDNLSNFFNQFLFTDFCNTTTPNTSDYCDNPSKYKNQYDFGLTFLIDNYKQIFNSINLNFKNKNITRDLFIYSEDYQNFCFYYYNFIEDHIHLPVDVIQATYLASGNSTVLFCHLIFVFFLISLFAILMYFTSYFLTKMKNVLNDCKDFVISVPNDFITETSSLRKFLMEMANEIKMQSNV